MRMRNLVRFYGILDIALVVWVVVKALLIGTIPVVTKLVESVEMAKSFGAPLSVELVVAAQIVFLSLLVSGPLLFLLRAAGGYLALLQTPFRVLYVIQPSFFFLALVKADGLVHWGLVGLIMALEFFKAASLVVWLRKERAKPALLHKSVE